VNDVARNAESLNKMSTHLEEKARGTSQTAQQMTLAMQGMAGGAQETIRSAQVLTAAIDQLNGTVESIARAASDQEHQVQAATAAHQMAAGARSEA
jgi:methyl-accepting chemotaxis protein